MKKIVITLICLIIIVGTATIGYIAVSANTKVEMEENIISLLGGRVAEKLILNDISTGASNDIERASKIARDMVTKYGMSEKVGLVSYDSNEEVFLGRDYSQSKAYSEKTSADIDDEVKNIIGGLYEKTKQLIIENKTVLDAVAKALLEKETLNEEEFESIYRSAFLEGKTDW